MDRFHKKRNVTETLCVYDLNSGQELIRNEFLSRIHLVELHRVLATAYYLAMPYHINVGFHQKATENLKKSHFVDKNDFLHCKKSSKLIF